MYTYKSMTVEHFVWYIHTLYIYIFQTNVFVHTFFNYQTRFNNAFSSRHIQKLIDLSCQTYSTEYTVKNNL